MGGQKIHRRINEYMHNLDSLRLMPGLSWVGRGRRGDGSDRGARRVREGQDQRSIGGTGPEERVHVQEGYASP